MLFCSFLRMRLSNSGPLRATNVAVLSMIVLTVDGDGERGRESA